MKTSRKFVTSPDILVAKGKNSVANATVLVAISSPAEIRRGSAPYEVCLQEKDLCMPGMVITVLTFESLYTDMKCSVKRRLGKMSLKYRSYRCRFLLPSLHSNQFLTRGQY